MKCVCVCVLFINEYRGHLYLSVGGSESHVLGAVVFHELLICEEVLCDPSFHLNLLQVSVEQVLCLHTSRVIAAQRLELCECVCERVCVHRWVVRDVSECARETQMGEGCVRAL